MASRGLGDVLAAVPKLLGLGGEHVRDLPRLELVRLGQHLLVQPVGVLHAGHRVVQLVKNL